jgi:hypothetical protein
LKSW